MGRLSRTCVSAGLLALVTAAAGGADPGLRMASRTPAEAREMSSHLDSMVREGRLRTSSTSEDTLVPGHRHQRLVQVHKGIRVHGGEVVREIDLSGTAVAVSGRLYNVEALGAEPALSAAQAREIVAVRGADVSRLLAGPELTILPRRDGGLSLAFSLVAPRRGDVRHFFVDAMSGVLLLDTTAINRQTPAVGRGRGVLNNDQKLSVASRGATFQAMDMLRPPRILTYDMKYDIFKAFFTVVGEIPFRDSDLGVDTDNNWTDGPTVDAHAYAGLVYDYFFKRFGRRGWNDADLPIPQIVNPARPEDIYEYGEDLPFFFVNAFYCCSGVADVSFMAYGQGAPAGAFVSGEVKPLAGGLDVVAHEVTHGMSDFTNGLSLSFCESGGLNEAFSDMMGVSVDFYHRPGTANYRLGEGVFPGGFRDMGNPRLLGDPDHVSVAQFCEEHYLAGIPNQAFYLAIEGGTNRTSGIAVTGVGRSNREQIEKVFYQAYTFRLFPSADFQDAALATITSARELYGDGSATERAVTQAWVAVGVL
jgi:Zn-dependent metalloprotease